MTVDEFRKFVKTVAMNQVVDFNFVRQGHTIRAAINKQSLVLSTDMDMIGGLIILNDIDGNKHFFGVGDIMTIMVVKEQATT